MQYEVNKNVKMMRTNMCVCVKFCYLISWVDGDVISSIETRTKLAKFRQKFGNIPPHLLAITSDCSRSVCHLGASITRESFITSLLVSWDSYLLQGCQLLCLQSPNSYRLKYTTWQLVRNFIHMKWCTYKLLLMWEFWRFMSRWSEEWIYPPRKT